MRVSKTVVQPELYAGWVHERNPTIGERLPELPGHEQWISVVIGGSVYDYRVRITAVRDDAVVGGLDEEATACECSTDDLLAVIDAGIDQAVERLRSTPVAMPPPSPEPRVVTAGRKPERAGPRRLSPVAGAGIGLMALGTVGVSVGIPLAVRSPELIPSAGSVTQYRSTRAPGIATAVLGGVAWAGGVSLLVFDALERRSSKVAFAPAAGFGFVGGSVVLAL
ncbi:MAG: hypothetical protein KDK70_04570 [Myxococcales bacterium]|nr:hypothetical protein [Myxococcales bacterium]